MAITSKSFGLTAKGEQTTLFTITNKNGFILEVTDFGATWVSAKVPASSGLIDTVLGYDTVTGFEVNSGQLGTIVGRHANRMAGASYTLDGVTHQMVMTNPAQNYNIHSGPDYYGKRMWKAEVLEADNAVKFTLFSPDGDQGLPGNLTLSVTYQLTEDNNVKLIYDAVSDAKTVLNPTNHVYFNLNGHDSGTIWSHIIHVDSTKVTETVNDIPTGKLLDVAGTHFDYTTARPVADPLDDNFCKEPHHTLTQPRITCTGEKSGIRMHVHTDLPGIQIYTANGLKAKNGKGGIDYGNGTGICFESQYYVNAINTDAPGFDKPILEKDVPFHSETWYRYEVM